ncbi:hypothetical protein Tco_1143520 [Tanacetum coccineum]
MEFLRAAHSRCEVFSLTLARVTVLDKLRGHLYRWGPEKPVVHRSFAVGLQLMNVPRGSHCAKLEKVQTSLPCTHPHDPLLIRTNFKPRRGHPKNNVQRLEGTILRGLTNALHNEFPALIGSCRGLLQAACYSNNFEVKFLRRRTLGAITPWHPFLQRILKGRNGRYALCFCSNDEIGKLEAVIGKDNGVFSPQGDGQLGRMFLRNPE